MRKQSYSQAFFICELRLAILDVLFGYCAVLPYICDVVVDADFRHRGVGAFLLKAITAEDTYRSLLGMLITEEAEQFYEPFGFRKDPICFMTRKETPEAITNE